MTKVNYEKLWKDHKEKKIQTYIKLHNGGRSLISFNAKSELAKELSEMDSRDETDEFGSVLYDLQTMNKEGK